MLFKDTIEIADRTKIQKNGNFSDRHIGMKQELLCTPDTNTVAEVHIGTADGTAEGAAEIRIAHIYERRGIFHGQFLFGRRDKAREKHLHFRKF